MRLIDVRTIELRWFNDDEIPDYAILSHTWGADEVSYQELVWINRIKAFTASYETPSSSIASLSSQDESSSLMLAAMETMLRSSTSFATNLSGVKEEDLLRRQGYSKIVNAAKEAKNLGFKYIWIDTCCIDKSSSAELQEAINSMYRWYRNSEVCIVYLEDVWPSEAGPGEGQTASEIARNAFDTSRWTKRGWTLQELVAPPICRFYLRNWRLLGEKEEYIQELSATTGIPVFVLEDSRSISEVSVAERMSWAADRQTTRVEDLAYCLLGLFDIQMPLLYGEGNKAFIRLQEEILKTTDDYSVFAWRAKDSTPSIYRGLLARSPIEFRDCQSFEREESMATFPINPTPIGLHVQLEFLPHPQDKTRILALIRASNSLNQRIAITLKCLDGLSQYARIDAGALTPINDWPTGQLRTIYVRQNPSIPPDFTTPEFSSFHIRRRFANQSIPPVRIISAFPRELWDSETHELRIPVSAPKAFGVLLLRVQNHAYAQSLSFPVAFGFDRATCHYWIKAVPDYVAPEGLGARAAWQTVLKRDYIPDECYDARTEGDVRRDIFVVGDSGVGISVGIKAGLVGDRVALVVSIDGLIWWH
ncbi:heterokaryon incompatibility protein-domain-containing protein [Boeremia exigua]|uniref:heterokaryon incompatibility protein-domain-containing protein n=1 Tax=Boeremia exigua TaxID=749465 RepID=UPI001E8E9E59|nr:heterokaryon incompatibility protein-domain-containing protein [Boeremia exigua]KAH6625370.1 heterokaryon incompatibility protein-domain-containing protein [Boeremia exigua]